MADERIRKQIAFLAARLMYERQESEYFTAKRKAARQLGISYRFRPVDLPSNREIRDQIQVIARLYEGDQRNARLHQMRIEALRLMRKLSHFHPRLIGSVWTGHIRKGSDIDIHVFTDSISSLTMVLDDMGATYDVEHKRIRKQNQERLFTHVHLHDRFDYELTVYPEEKLRYVFRSSITGQAIERASLAELEQFLKAEKPGIDLDAEVDRLEDYIDRFELYRVLLTPLENVKQSRKYHPEGDALYHSLQVFELARAERPYDEEFLLAALLHDVGKAIDPSDHVQAGLEALEGAITPRTEFLIAHHMEAISYRDGSMGQRARRRLEDADDFEDLMLLRQLDEQGRVPGADVPEINAALEYIRALEHEPYLK